MSYQIIFHNKETGRDMVANDFTINNKKAANSIRRKLRDKLRKKGYDHIEVRLKKV